MKNNIVSFSGGKDSTAMLLMMLERNEPIHSVVFFDTGWEFPQMYDHLDGIEKNTGVKIIKLQPGKSFDHWMFDRKVVPRKGPLKGQVRFVGLGWPRADFRWCTGKKLDAIAKYRNSVKNNIMSIGIALDEEHRTLNGSKTQKKRQEGCRWPLIEYGVTEAAALQYCYDQGYDWGGLYELFGRVSCFCCPLQRVSELRALRKNFPDLWGKLLDMDGRSRTDFKHGVTIEKIDQRFAEEDMQMNLFETVAG